MDTLKLNDIDFDDIIKKGERIKPRYNAQEQWWWEFTDPSIKGLFESMDRYMIGLKQNHDAVWSTFSKPKKKKTRDNIVYDGHAQHKLVAPHIRNRYTQAKRKKSSDENNILR